MNNKHLWVVIGALALAGIVGGIAYNAGLAHGAEGTGRIAPHQPGWHHHHGGFFFVPLFFLAVFLVARRGWYGPHYGRHFDEWHRRAHERMWNEGSSGTPSAP